MAKKLTIEQLERRVGRLEKRVKTLEEERDEARKDAVMLRIFTIIRQHPLYWRFGTYLSSEQIRFRIAFHRMHHSMAGHGFVGQFTPTRKPTKVRLLGLSLETRRGNVLIYPNPTVHVDAYL